MAQRTKPPAMWEGAWVFSCEAVTKEPLTQSKEFAAAAYMSSAFGDPEPDMDLEDEATGEAGIEMLREAKGRITQWTPNFNDENDRRFLTYLVKTGKFGGKPDLDVNSPTAGIEAIRTIHNWYLAKHHASWPQFGNWLRRHDPDNEPPLAEEDEANDDKEIKKEGKPQIPPKKPESSRKKNPGGAGENDTPTKKPKPKAPKTPGAADMQTPPKTNKSPNNRPKPTTAAPRTPTKTSHPATKSSSKKKMKKSDLPNAAVHKQRRGMVTDFTKKLIQAGLGEALDAKKIQKWLNKLSLNDRKAGSKKGTKGKDKETFPDGDPGPSQGPAQNPIGDEMDVDDHVEDQEVPNPEMDPAFQYRESSRQQFQRHDEAYGRFVLRSATQLTQLDIEYLRRGNNNLMELAQQHANLREEEFLQAIFASDWNTAAGPTERPVKAKRVAADAGVPCGIFTRDAYNKAERKTMDRTGKAPGELGFQPLPERRKGQTVYLKVFPSQLNTKSEFVCKKQRWCSDEDVRLEGGRVFGDYLLSALANYDERDMASCQRTNRETLVWLARFRLYSWYTVQEPKLWNQNVAHYNIAEETPFEPMRPLRTTQQMFGSALSTNLRIAGGLALDPIDQTPNGVRRSGAAEPVNVAADLRIHDREGLTLDEEPKGRLRRPPVDIDEEETPRPPMDIDEDFWIEDDESEASGEYQPSEPGSEPTDA
ncbi:hypothetical protein BGZ57DRAFT_124751 [Hyaloscypha finlandica]|nr:hypothetical protein BGZ57DRAFT_124751 [Hyaloscypha finlandica]